MTFRYCPRCATPLVPGEIAGLRRQYCPAPGCDFIHFVNPLPVACCLVLHGGGVVLIRRGIEPRLGYWALPAGYIEAHETTEQAARRETREETGLEVELLELLGVHTFVARPPRPNGLGIFYLARATGGTLAPGDDATDARIFPLDGLPPDLAFPSHVHYLGVIRGRKGTEQRDMET